MDLSVHHPVMPRAPHPLTRFLNLQIIAQSMIPLRFMRLQQKKDIIASFADLITSVKENDCDPPPIIKLTKAIQAGETLSGSEK